MPKQPQGKTINKFRTYLENVYLDIVHCDCVFLGGFKYTLLLVDTALDTLGFLVSKRSQVRALFWHPKIFALRWDAFQRVFTPISTKS